MATGPGLAWQACLFGGDELTLDTSFAGVDRTPLDPVGESWVDHGPGWVANPDTLFAGVLESAPWAGHTRHMYDRKVLEPRLRAPGWEAAPAIVEEMGRLLSDRYGAEFTSTGFNLYRDGRDGVAWHGDRVARDLPTATIAIVSLGGRRRFLLRPKGGGGSCCGPRAAAGGRCRSWCRPATCW